MISLTGIHLYPIKSCGAINLNEAKVESLGLALDRRWMLVDQQGIFLSQRAFPLMASIRLNLASESELIVRAPGMAPLVLPTAVPIKAPRLAVTVWGTALEALDCGVFFHDWFSSYLGTDARLVCFDPEVVRQCSLRWTDGHPVMTQFSDGFPLLITSTASLDDLNARMQRKGAPAIPMNRFRPNLILSGLPAYEEDYVDTLTLGEPGREIVLRLVKPCTRCSMPGIDQHSGLRDVQWPHEPLDTLTTYRADARVDGVTFGQNAIVITGVGNVLRLGMPVQAELNF